MYPEGLLSFLACFHVALAQNELNEIEIVTEKHRKV